MSLDTVITQVTSGVVDRREEFEEFEEVEELDGVEEVVELEELLVEEISIDGLCGVY